MKIKRTLPILFLLATGLSLFFAYKPKDDLAQCIKNRKPAWAEEQLSSDFADFPSLSLAALESTYQKIEGQKILAYRYRIIDQEIYRIGDEHAAMRAPIFDKILKRLRRSCKLPDLDFIICMMDGVPESYVTDDFWIVEDRTRQAPLLAWAKKKQAPHIILIPDVLTTIENSWQNDISRIEETIKSIPWENRHPKAFWRGTSSDKKYTLENYTGKPRFIISRLSQEYPDRIDAGFCKSNDEIFTHLFDELGLLKGHAKLEEHLKYKYLPVLDGWMCTYPGYQWRLLSGSLTMKQESDEVQYFYSALKPYVYYLPIQNSMEDLLKKIQWAEENDAACREIAQNARNFAKDNLMPNKIYAYLYWVLERYASLQNFDLKSLKKDTQSDPKWKHIL